MTREDILYLTITDGTWLLLLLEHVVFKLELALPLATIWGIGMLLINIWIIRKYAVTKKH